MIVLLAIILLYHGIEKNPIKQASLHHNINPAVSAMPWKYTITIASSITPVVIVVMLITICLIIVLLTIRRNRSISTTVEQPKINQEDIQKAKANLKRVNTNDHTSSSKTLAKYV